MEEEGCVISYCILGLGLVGLFFWGCIRLADIEVKNCGPNKTIYVQYLEPDGSYGHHIYVSETDEFGESQFHADTGTGRFIIGTYVSHPFALQFNSEITVNCK